MAKNELVKMLGFLITEEKKRLRECETFPIVSDSQKNFYEERRKHHLDKIHAYKELKRLSQEDYLYAAL